MQFRVVVPEGCVPGQVLRIHIADGTEANVTIPDGVFPGDSFVFEAPTHQMQNPGLLRKNRQQQQQKQQNQKQQKQKQNDRKKSKQQAKKQKQQQQQKQQQEDIASSSVVLVANESFTANTNAVPHLVLETEASGGSQHYDTNNNNANTNSRTEVSVVDDSSQSRRRRRSSPDTNRKDVPRSSNGNDSKLMSFLEREILDFQDFLLALGVGLLVGTAMVFGFLLGVVHATKDIYAIHPVERTKQPRYHQQSWFSASTTPTGEKATTMTTRLSHQKKTSPPPKLPQPQPRKLLEFQEQLLKIQQQKPQQPFEEAGGSSDGANTNTNTNTNTPPSTTGPSFATASETFVNGYDADDDYDDDRFVRIGSDENAVYYIEKDSNYNYNCDSDEGDGDNDGDSENCGTDSESEQCDGCGCDGSEWDDYMEIDGEHNGIGEEDFEIES